jgi:hypothetical protein
MLIALVLNQDMASANTVMKFEYRKQGRFSVSIVTRSISMPLDVVR